LARTSRFKTPAEAEAWALDKGAPRRGSGIPIVSRTRGLAAAWITACGVPAAIVGNLSVEQRNEAWHDLTGATVERFKLLPMPRVSNPDADPWEAPKPSPGRFERFPTRFSPTPAPVAPITKEDTMPAQEHMILTRTPAQQPAIATNPGPARDSHEAKLRAIADLFAAPAMDEATIIEIVTRHLGATISAATTSATEQARVTLADVVEEARAIVNGAPRTLRIEIAGKVKEMPAAQRHPMFDTLLTIAVCSKEPRALHPMLVGPPASGKTTAAEQVAQALGLPFYTNGALTGAHELTGYKDAAGIYHTTPFRQAFEHGGVYLCDEIDGSHEAVPLLLNSALANGFMGFPDQAAPVRAHPNFYFIGAANTYGRGADRLFVGRTQLDAATTDRLAMLDFDYDEALERSLAQDDAWTSYVQAARAACSDLKIRHVISPRATYGGAIYRRTGMPFDLVCNLTIWKGLDRDQRARITTAIPEGIARRAQVARITLAAE
jgi:cobaltochelatase CobS